MADSQAIIVGGGIAALAPFDALDETRGRSVFITSDTPAGVGAANFGEIPSTGAFWVLGQLYDLNATQAADPRAIIIGQNIANIATWGPTLGTNEPVIIGHQAGAVGAATVITDGIAIGRGAITDGNAVVIGSGVTVNCNAGTDNPVIINAQALGTAVSSLIAIGSNPSWASNGGICLNGRNDTAVGGIPVAISGRVEGQNSVAIGSVSVCGGAFSVAIGNGATAVSAIGTSYDRCIAIGENATATGTGVAGDAHAIAIGAGATATGNPAATTGAIAIGQGATAAGGQCVIGSTTRTYNLILANVQASAGSDKTVQGNSDASGTNIARGNFIVRAGAPTGNAAGGSVLLQSPATGASGAVVQTLVTRVTVTGGSGLVAIAAPSSGHALEVTGLTPNEAVRIVAGAGTDPSIRFNGYTNGAAAAVGTLNNSPAAGDPAFWLRLNIAGTDRFIPCW